MDMEHTVEEGTWTPLHQAARAGDLGMARLLLEAGADLEARAPGGATALHHAAYFGHPEVVRELLAWGADPGAVDKVGYTPLQWARVWDHRHEEPGATVAVLELAEGLSG
jgi:ankyrin repeat protein